MQANKSYMSLKVFNEMRTQKIKPNICTYTALTNAFARDGQCEKAEETFELLQEAGLEPDVYAYNALMEAYRLVPEILRWFIHAAGSSQKDEKIIINLMYFIWNIFELI